MPSRRLDSALRANAPEPLYAQVKQWILAYIDDGSWRAGHKIPSENQLVRRLGVSRMTVHRALRELTQEGRLQRVHGVGSFVAEPPHHASLIEIRNIADEIRQDGGQHRAVVCRQRRIAADDAVAERLEIAIGTEVFHVILVHHRNELPIQLEERYVAADLVPDFLDIDFSVLTPSEHLLAAIRPDEMEHVVQAIQPDAETCARLAIVAGEPCLRLARRTWHGDRIVTWARLTYPSSRYDLGARYTLHAAGTTRHGEQDAPSLIPGGYQRKPIGRDREPS